MHFLLVFVSDFFVFCCCTITQFSFFPNGNKDRIKFLGASEMKDNNECLEFDSTFLIVSGHLKWLSLLS